uniref:Uncharacterized protein n=1 Tax=Rhizophora mucronata TaxID=61149 RepID=A0A2P2MZV5_RHIMU
MHVWLICVVGRGGLRRLTILLSRLGSNLHHQFGGLFSLDVMSMGIWK